MIEKNVNEWLDFNRFLTKMVQKNKLIQTDNEPFTAKDTHRLFHWQKLFHIRTMLKTKVEKKMDENKTGDVIVNSGFIKIKNANRFERFPWSHTHTHTQMFT